MNKDLILPLLQLRYELETLLSKNVDYTEQKTSDLLEEHDFVSTVMQDFNIMLSGENYRSLELSANENDLLIKLEYVVAADSDIMLPDNKSGFTTAIHNINQYLQLSIYRNHGTSLKLYSMSNNDEDVREVDELDDLDDLDTDITWVDND